jgi:hypothetical protein
MLDLFALLILLVLFAAVIAAWVMLGMLPGRIARQRNHPQADAIAVCGWFGVLTMGILCPLAFIWAYTRPAGVPIDTETTVAGEKSR